MADATSLAYEHIRAAIMAGDYRAGDRIKEALVAARLGISRTPVRQALQRLTAQGFTEMPPNQGARVVAWSLEELAEITELRALLEGYGAGQAAGRISAAQVAELEGLAARMESVVAGPGRNLDALTDLNCAFHMKIIEASGSRRLAESIGGLAHPLLVQRRFSHFDATRLGRSMAHHRELIDALAAGNADWATSVMRAHILASSDGMCASPMGR